MSLVRAHSDRVTPRVDRVRLIHGGRASLVRGKRMPWRGRDAQLARGLTDRRCACGARKTRVSAMRGTCIGARGLAPVLVTRAAAPVHRGEEREDDWIIRTASRRGPIYP